MSPKKNKEKKNLNKNKQKKKRSNKKYTSDEMQEAIKIVQNGQSVYKTSKLFNIPEATLRFRIQKKHTDKVGHPTIFTTDQEKIMADCLNELADLGFGFSNLRMKLLAHDFAIKNNIKTNWNNLPSDEWCIGN